MTVAVDALVVAGVTADVVAAAIAVAMSDTSSIALMFLLHLARRFLLIL